RGLLPVRASWWRPPRAPPAERDACRLPEHGMRVEADIDAERSRCDLESRRAAQRRVAHLGPGGEGWCGDRNAQGAFAVVSGARGAPAAASRGRARLEIAQVPPPRLRRAESEPGLGGGERAFEEGERVVARGRMRGPGEVLGARGAGGAAEEERGGHRAERVA